MGIIMFLIYLVIANVLFIFGIVHLQYRKLDFIKVIAEKRVKDKDGLMKFIGKNMIFMALYILIAGFAILFYSDKANEIAYTFYGVFISHIAIIYIKSQKYYRKATK